MHLNFYSWHWDSPVLFVLGTMNWFFGSLPLEYPLAFIYQLGANTTQTVLWYWGESMQLTMESRSFGCVHSIQPFSDKNYGEFLSKSSANNISWIQSLQSAWSLLESVIICLSSSSLLDYKASRRAIHKGPRTGFLRFAAPTAGNIYSLLNQYALKSLLGAFPSHHCSSWIRDGKNNTLHFGLHCH